MTTGWCVLTGREEQARKILSRLNGKIPDYNIEEELEVMKHTVALEREIAALHAQNKYIAIFQGVDGVRSSQILQLDILLTLGIVANIICMLGISRSTDHRFGSYLLVRLASHAIGYLTEIIAMSHTSLS
jgi:hypothetical protein